MFTRSIIVLCTAIAVASTSAVAAKDVGVPNIDIQKRCQNSKRATEEMLGKEQPDAFDQCVKGEQAARELLVKVWNTAPASVKALCAQPWGFSPSYVEWLTCGEMARDVRNMRAAQPVSIQTSKLCPIVEYLQDGSVSRVISCPIPTRPLY